MRLSTILPFLLSTIGATYADCSLYAKVESLRKSDSAVGSECACNVLTALFDDKVHLQGEIAHTTEATYHWDSRGCLEPRCVFIPINAHEVALGVVVLGLCKSQFAIRAGGHMPVVGAANSDGGVLIALSGFKHIKVSEDEKSVEAGPGLNWYELYAAIEPHGIIVVGGRLKTIGVGGLTLGGGISYFTSKYGFTMDNVLAYEIVTGDGKILNVTAKENPDLFWALKGGGNNFGIVTKFTFAAYKAPKVSTIFQVQTEDIVEDYITAIANFANYHENIDTGAGGIFTFSNVPSPNKLHGLGPDTIFRVMAVQIGGSEKPEVFRNFTNLPNVFSSTAVSSLADWVLPLDSSYQQGREIFAMHSMLVDEASIHRMWKTFKAASDKMAHISDLYSSITFQPISKSAARVAKTNGIGNTWGIDDRQPYLWWIISTHWQNAEDDEEVIAWQKSLREEMHTENIKLGVGLGFMYYNDCGDDQDAFSGLPPANLERLKKIRDKYDPNLVFTELVSGGFKLDGAMKFGSWTKDEL